jgi:LysR family transcriptional regulator, hydrogen peroxide-inducible genes activator
LKLGAVRTLTDIKLKDLRYLVAVADTQHFGRAAARCFVSQPTLSMQLKKLEAYLGLQLIERQPRRVALTPAGERIAERARRIIEASDEVAEIARAEHDPLGGRLRLALLPTIGPYLLPLVTQKLHRALPRLELLLYEYQTASMLEKLQAGDIDLGILALPVPTAGLASHTLYEEPFVLLVPTQHALAGQGAVRTAALGGETLLLLEDGHCLRDQALAVCSRVSVHEMQDFRATSIETLRQMVAAGAGVTLLPALAASGAYSTTRGAVVRPFVKPAPLRVIGSIWRKTSVRSAVISEVNRIIAAAVKF